MGLRGGGKQVIKIHVRPCIHKPRGYQTIRQQEMGVSGLVKGPQGRLQHT